MKGYRTILSLLVLLSCEALMSQEADPDLEVEESAAVFLEEYSDAFQEHFFEALKQKGIENYDKAINSLLKCKELDPGNRVVDHELAKVYVKDKQYNAAESYALEALTSAPENPWYLETMVSVSQKQGAPLQDLKTRIPYDNDRLKENLALIYYRQTNYNNALAILKETKKTAFSDDLTAKINELLSKRTVTSRSVGFTNTQDRSEAGSADQYKTRIKGLITANSLPLLQQLSEEALERYPSQPYFYFANGYALNKKAKHREAISILEAALDYMIDDISLSNKIYKELSDAYTALHNPVKANMYLRKIKPGF